MTGLSRLSGATAFAPADIGAAADLLDRMYLTSLAAGDGEPALETALQWGLAHRAGDLEAIGEMMAEGSALVDHRHLGLGEVPREQLLALLDARWESNSVALVAEYERWTDRAVLARVVYVGHHDWELIEDSVSYTVFDIDASGRILRMDTYDGDAEGRTAATQRYEDLTVSPRS